MANCRICGKELTDEKDTCSECIAVITEAENKNKIGMWQYFGLIALFVTPFVGFVAAIVMSFFGKNKSRRNFARAILIWMLVFILIGALAFFGSMALISGLIEQFSGGDIQELINSMM